MELGGDWEMIDARNNKKIKSSDLDGSYYLLYFGFCNCPDICPTSLTKIGKMLRILNDNKDKNKNVKSVFVSVDPERDDNKKIVEFLDFFNKDIIGVRGEG